MSTLSRRSAYRSYQYLEPGRDYRAFELAAEVGRVPAWNGRLSREQAERARGLVASSIVVSLHDHPCVYPLRIEQVHEYNRAGRQVTGFEGLARSGMTAVIDNFMDGACCITSSMGWKWTDVVHDLGMRFSDLAHQDDVILARDVDDIRRAHETHRLALIAGLEAATMIENELDRIDVLYGFGVRQMGIAYSEANTLGSGLKERRDGGLTAFGVRAVERMNRLGMAIDVSHSGDRTCLDVIEASSRPVLITHAGSRTVWDSPRMKSDEVIVACARKGGVIGIEAAPHTTLSEQHSAHSIESVMDHFTHCVELVGVDHVAFGPDTLFGDHVGLHRAFATQLSVGEIRGSARFEEVDYVDGLENPGECFHNIAGWLVKHGWSDDDIRKVIGGNALRVLGEIW
ncbi:MAG TPA: membrane dipeptidase [Candidatus Dormibacteraeota bacterium]|nr:membrane dipeptidase [Candidatus Dormibacteraeota bacterium]